MDSIFFEIEKGIIDKVKKYMEYCKDINLRNRDGYTLFHWSVVHNQKEIMELLFRNGADINIKANDEYYPLVTACSLGYESLVRFIVESGKLKNKDSFYLPLHIAAAFGHNHIIRYLVYNGFNINQKDHFGEGYTPLLWATQENKIDTIELLINLGADVNISCEGITPLYIASSQGNNDIVNLLIHNGSNIDGVEEMGLPLAVASSYGHLNVVETLVSNNANIDKRDKEGRTALFYCVLHGHKQIEEYLVLKGANTDTIDNNGYSIGYVKDNRSKVLEDE